jgi:hypothetical protein
MHYKDQLYQGTGTDLSNLNNLFKSIDSDEAITIYLKYQDSYQKQQIIKGIWYF